MGLWPKFRVLTKISTFDEHLDFLHDFLIWTKFRVLTKNRVLTKIYPRFSKKILQENSPRFRLLTKISTFEQYFDFWPQLLFLTKFSTKFDEKIFLHDSVFWPKLWLLTNNWLLRQFRLFPRFRLLINISTFAENLGFLRDFDHNLNYWPKFKKISFSAAKVSMADFSNSSSIFGKQ